MLTVQEKTFRHITLPQALLLLFLACFLILNGSPATANVSTPNPNPEVSSSNAPVDVLADPQNRISDEFAIPASLRQRTEFWFDVYTKYGSNQHVIHHVLYPWIVYRVVDTTSILNGPGHRWTKYHKSEKYIKNEIRSVRKILSRLAKKRSYKRLSREEREIFNALASVKGSRKRVLREAAENVRTQLGQRDFFVSGLEQSARYLPVIEKTFADNGIPVEISRLPFVESSFNVKAESKVGASGIWQIMPLTGKRYLTINNSIDERNSPLKASLAAAEILKSNFRSLKAWSLALTAYNHGPTGVRRALRAAKVDNLEDLIAKYHDGSFRFASANFYTSFLAALHAEKYHSEIFAAADLSKEQPISHTVVAIERATRVKRVLKQIGLTESELLKYNLDLKNALKTNARLPKGYKLILPVHSRGALKKELVKGRPLFKEAKLNRAARASG